ncbi:DrmB family protein [Clostridium tertium]|uniref:DrmB family protein n=1 Tax=Clostridium tertium TaxID=1559 RepID=UPI00356976C5
MSDLKRKYQISMKRMKIRASTLVFPFGPGAMIDMPDWVLMTASAEYWDKKKLTSIHDERLEKVLGVKGFKSPVVKEDNNDSDEDNNDKLYIPFVQFPTWYFCPRCRTFKTLKEWDKDYKKVNGEDEIMKRPVCSNLITKTNKTCRVKLAPARLVVACANGHIDDFPWIEWTHFKNNKKICNNPKLVIKTSGVSSGLEGISVECKTCNARVSLSGTFTSNDKNEFQQLENKINKSPEKFLDKDKTISFKCSKNRPWDGTSDKECGLYPKTVQRGAINIYFPKIESSIVIPPYSDKFTKSVEESYEFERLIIKLEDEDREDKIKEIIDNASKKISREIELNEKIVKKIILRKLENVEDGNSDTIDKMKYKEEEYKALIGELSYDILNQADFKVEPKEGKEYKRNYLSKVVLIHKMREVRVLTGFSRINGPDNNIMDSVDEEKTENREYRLIKPLSDRDWYPAIDINGEGIFIKLNEKMIEKWIKENPEVNERVNNIDKRYSKMLVDKGFSIRKITPKFVLLHTLSHIIIKELSFKCGYSSTSLRERIYCNDSDDKYSMCGILIYTANGDSEGTLGGLIRQGKSDRLPKIIDGAIEKARFCSSDPVCIESLGQGRDGLNLAACFSCCLISETSCEEFNTLLDRALIVGTLDNQKIGFFNNFK